MKSRLSPTRHLIEARVRGVAAVASDEGWEHVSGRDVESSGHHTRLGIAGEACEDGGRFQAERIVETERIVPRIRVEVDTPWVQEYSGARRIQRRTPGTEPMLCGLVTKLIVVVRALVHWEAQ